MQLRLGCKKVDVLGPETGWITVEGTPNTFASAGAGAPGYVANPVAASEQGYVLAMTDNDELYGCIDLEELDIDLTRDIQVQLDVQVQEAAKANIDFQVDVKGLAAGAAPSDAKVTPDASVTMPALSNTVANELVQSPKVALDLINSSGVNVIASDKKLMFAVTLTDKGTATADNVHLLCVKFWYTRKISSALGVREIT